MAASLYCRSLASWSSCGVAEIPAMARSRSRGARSRGARSQGARRWPAIMLGALDQLCFLLYLENSCLFGDLSVSRMVRANCSGCKDGSSKCVLQESSSFTSG